MKTTLKLTSLAILFVLAALLPSNLMGQKDWALGIRLGDPSGLTIKKYMGSNALEFSIGRTHWFNGEGWYDKRFYNWYNDQKYPYKDFQYWGYKGSAPIGVQVHYLFHKPISSLGDESISGLDWYYGFGGQFRYQSYSFDYRYKLDGDPNWYYDTGGQVSDLDIGADGVIGLEYTFKDTPISLFLDMTLFMEIFDDPFRFWMQGGFGGRYNF